MFEYGCQLMRENLRRRFPELDTAALEQALQAWLRNRTDVAPQDMRIRLCTDKSAAYEASRDALYPMGLPGHETYLRDQIPAQVHAITTWADDKAADVPLPKPRPS